MHRCGESHRPTLLQRMESSHRMPEGCCWGGWIAASLIRRMASCLPTGATHDCSSTRSRPWSPARVRPPLHEDLNDHDELRHDRCSLAEGQARPPVAGKSTPEARGRITRSITMRRAWKHCSTSSSMATSDAEGDRARPRRHRRHAGPVLPWPPAIATCRRPPARRQAAPRQYRRGTRSTRARIVARIRARCGSCRGDGLLPRGADGVVRSARPTRA